MLARSRGDLSETTESTMTKETDLGGDQSAHAEQRLQASELHAVLSALADPLLVLDELGTIRLANDACQRVFGYEPSELVGEAIELLTREPFRSDTAHKRSASNPFRAITAKRKDGGEVDLELALTPVASDPSAGGARRLAYCASFRDVSRWQQAERQLMRTFREMGASAGHLAHEIKNPVTAVNLALRAVSRKLGEEEEAVLADLVERMKRLEAQMRGAFSTVRPIELQATDADVEEILAAVAARARSSEKRVEARVVSQADDSRLRLDRGLIEEALGHLIQNSLDALESGGRIELGAERENDSLVLRVDDDGPGIAESVRNRLFQPFVSSKIDGTGFGLTLARRIIEAHGGTIEARESPLGGARIEIRLPRAGL